MRCLSCPGPSVCNPVPASGIAPCPILLLGAGPGPHEAKTGIPYSGQAGEELNETYLALARIQRDDVAVSNAQQCYFGEDKVQEKRAVDCARAHLPALFARVQPEVLVLMGGVTCRIADRRIRLDMQHGRPVWGSVLGGMWEGWIWPSYEPALGMRETTKMTPLLDDFRNLGGWWRGEWEPPKPTPGVVTDYRLVGNGWQDIRDFLDYLRYGGQLKSWDRDWRYCPPVDTERHGSAVWSVQLSVAADTARLVRAENTEALRELAGWVREKPRTLTLHNAGQDLDMWERLGLPPVPYVDTMQRAFHLGSVPQGLKGLAYRLLGIEMRSWEDTVWPASVEAWEDWAQAGIVIAQGQLQREVVTELKRARCLECGHQHTTGTCKSVTDKQTGTKCGCSSTNHTNRKVEYQPAAVESVLRHVLQYTSSTKDDDEPYNPWKAIAKMRDSGLRGKVPDQREWEALEEELGPAPILGIGNCELGEAVRYACGDADMTGQVAVELEKMTKSERWKVPQEDWDQ